MGSDVRWDCTHVNERSRIQSATAGIVSPLVALRRRRRRNIFCRFQWIERGATEKALLMAVGLGHVKELPRGSGRGRLHREHSAYQHTGESRRKSSANVMMSCPIWRTTTRHRSPIPLCKYTPLSLSLSVCVSLPPPFLAQSVSLGLSLLP